jgi:hypothetical protein
MIGISRVCLDAPIRLGERGGIQAGGEYRG